MNCLFNSLLEFCKHLHDELVRSHNIPCHLFEVWKLKIMLSVKQPEIGKSYIDWTCYSVSGQHDLFIAQHAAFTMLTS